jgi:hypothetical protein
MSKSIQIKISFMALLALAACDDPLVSPAEGEGEGESTGGEGEGEGDNGEGEGEGDGSEGEGEGDGQEGEGDGGEGEGEGEGEGALEPGQELTALDPTPQPMDAPPGVVEDSVVDHQCEGDEDFCEPSPDLGLPDFDILASWSFIDGDEFVIQTLYHGIPFICTGGVDVGIDVAGISGEADVPVCSRGQCPLFEIALGVLTWNQNFGDGDTDIVYYPPSDLGVVFRGVVAPEFQIRRGFLHEGIRYGRGGHLVEFRVPMAIVSTDGSAPNYTLQIGYLTEPQPGMGDEGLIALSSQGGVADGEAPSRVPVIAAAGGAAACQQ